MCDCNYHRSMDMKTPRNVFLSAFYKRSFAYHTVKVRMPVILTQIIDNLARSKDEIVKQYGEAAKAELKSVIGEISKFNYEVQTNKPLTPISDNLPDAGHYNEYIERQATEEGQTTHFHTIWLLTECYMYRRLKSIIEKTTLLKNYDLFRNQKEQSFLKSIDLISQMGDYFLKLIEDESISTKDEFINLVKINLWGNKCDLSISLGKVEGHSALIDTSSLEKNILVDHSERIYEAVAENSSDIIDVVFDNSGYELFTDLCLADFLVTKNLAKKIRFYVKLMPWFISDVMTPDFYWTLEQMKESEVPALVSLSERWNQYLKDGTWTIEESDFWTLPFEFTYMSRVDPKLYRKLAEAKVVIVKGDLNYRKLFGEKNWDPTTSVDEGLQNFHPAKLVILRTVKADIICGLETEGLAEELEAKDAKWMENGDYGLIQFSDKIINID